MDWCALVLASAGLNAAGYLFNAYHRFVWYDELCHLLTPFSIMAAAALLWLRRSQTARQLSGSTFATAVAGAGLALGLAWEMFEYAIGILGDGVDTAIDLALDVTGSALAAAWIWNSVGSRREPDIAA